MPYFVTVVLALVAFIAPSPAHGAKAAICTLIEQQAYEAFAQKAAEHTGWSNSLVNGILQHEKWGDRAEALIEFEQWISENRQARNFYNELGAALAKPEHSSTDNVTQEYLRLQLVHVLLEKYQLKMPEHLQRIFAGALQQHPTILPDPPLSQPVVQARLDGFLGKFTFDNYVTIYKAMKHQIENESETLPRELKPLLLGLAVMGGRLPPTGPMKAMLRQDPTGTRMFRDGMRHYVGMFVRQYTNDHANQMNDQFNAGTARQFIDQTFEAWADNKKVPVQVRPFVKGAMLAMIAPAPPPAIPGDQVRGDARDYAGNLLRDIRREYLVELREKEAAEAAAQPAAPPVQAPARQQLAPARPDLVAGPPPVQPPAQSRRRRAREQAAAQAAADTTPPTAAQPPKLKDLPKLGQTETEELFSRVSPTDSHYRKFLAAMDEARPKLGSATGYLKFEEKIATAMQWLELGGSPFEVHVIKTRMHGVLEMWPSGKGQTTRLFIGHINGDYYILRLVHDIKSGQNTEQRILSELEAEVKALESTLK